MAPTMIAILVTLEACATALTLYGASTNIRYVVNTPGDQLPFDLAGSVTAAKGRIVRAFPQLGIAVAVSSSAEFVGALSRRLNIPAESIAPVRVSRLPGAASRRKTSGPGQADDWYNSGRLWGIQRVRAPDAWKAGFTGSHKTVVAVVDTGVAWNHPDLKPNVVLAKCFTSQSSCNPYPSFSDHGTHVAGIIAAAFGGGSVVGVGPNLALASYNVFEEVSDCGLCSYEDSRWAAMIDAADRGFSVINVSQGATYSLGGKGSNETAALQVAEKKVINYVNKSGAVAVASAGNGATNLNGPVLHLPGDTSGYLNIAATAIRPVPRYWAGRTFDVRAYYSNYGAAITLSAPGGDCGTDIDCDPAAEDWFEHMILSTVVAPDPECAATADCPIGYDWKAGTSMAAAHVSGVAGLVRDAQRNLNGNALEALLKSTVDSAGSRIQFGHGIIDAFAAVRKAVSRP